MHYNDNFGCEANQYDIILYQQETPLKSFNNFMPQHFVTKPIRDLFT